MMDYQDFVVRIRDYAENGRYASYNLEILDSPLGRQAHAMPVVYDALELQDLLNYLTRYKLRLALEAKDVEAIGRHLADKLLHPSVLFWLKASLFQTLTRREGLRITLVIEEPAVAALPWEYLNVSLPRHGSGVLALNPMTPIVRDQSFYGSTPPLDLSNLKRGLFTVAEPASLSDLDEYFGESRVLSKEEGDQIRKRLGEPDERLVKLHADLGKAASPDPRTDTATNTGTNGASAGASTEAGSTIVAGNVREETSNGTPKPKPTWGPLIDDLTVKSNLTAKGLEAIVEEAQDYDVFCFYGHGGNRIQDNIWQPGFGEDASYGILALEKEDSQEADFYLADELALKLRKLNVKVAVICACKSGIRDVRDLWSDTAPTLLEEGRVPVVIGMQNDVSKLAAFTFTQGSFRHSRKISPSSRPLRSGGSGYAISTPTPTFGSSSTPKIGACRCSTFMVGRCGRARCPTPSRRQTGFSTSISPPPAPLPAR